MPWTWLGQAVVPDTVLQGRAEGQTTLGRMLTDAETGRGRATLSLAAIVSATWRGSFILDRHLRGVYPAREPIDLVPRPAEVSLAEMRVPIVGLRLESLETESLVAALDKQVAAIEARHGVVARSPRRDGATPRRQRLLAFEGRVPQASARVA